MKLPLVKSFLLKATSATFRLRWWRKQSASAPRPITGAATAWHERALPNPFFEGLAG